MGIKYLWVDAICIIQSSIQDQYLKDWEKEASRMASYYSNARCLISALSASDSSQGIFAERLAQKYPLRNCAIAFDDDKNEVLYLPVPELVFHSQFHHQPLLTRGCISSIADPVHFEYAHGSSLKSLIRVGGKGEVFPPVGSAVDFGTPEKRSLRLEAPLLNIIPADVRAEFEKTHRLRSFKFMDESWCAEVEMIFDAPRLVPEDFGHAKVLMLSVLDHQTEVEMAGLVVRPQDAYYERVGFVSFKTPLEPLERSTKLADLMARLEQKRSNVILI
ncbi:hypothetical protein K4K52_008648 [Colletotrichum sp. SAR 10_76]|nr:hypothetical protein K4K51_009785 [Colletotrichum sp. SAR 10_75]KAI8199797.1 hypothetical protein K4K52_008648 [Colletotrichum sp. SAR 10_76]